VIIKWLVQKIMKTAGATHGAKDESTTTAAAR